MIPLPAYIDPGSGSLIIQAAIAAVIAIPIFLRSQIARVVRTLRHSDEPSGGDDPAAGR
ncbi:MAG: hypothetical protein ACRDIL_15835 [Candidatus Limnocylindrales bacterium]